MTDPYAAVNLTVVYNPLDVTDHTRTTLEWGAGRTLADYLDGLPGGIDWAVCVNADPIAPEHWAATHLSPDDWITVMPVPHGGGGGGGGGKQVMRLVAMIAVAVVAWYAAPYLAGTALGVEGAAFGTAGITALEGVAGASLAMGVAGAVVPGVGGLAILSTLPEIKE